MCIALTINKQHINPTFICTLEENEIEETINRIVKEFQEDYGLEQVKTSNVSINNKILDSYPSMYRICRIDCKSSIDNYTIWLEFHKSNINDINKELLRNFIM